MLRNVLGGGGGRGGIGPQLRGDLFQAPGDETAEKLLIAEGPAHDELRLRIAVL